VVRTGDEPVAFEPAQPLGEDLRSDSRHEGLELGESQRAVARQDPEHVRGPAAEHEVYDGPDRTRIDRLRSLKSPRRRRADAQRPAAPRGDRLRDPRVPGRPRAQRPLPDPVPARGPSPDGGVAARQLRLHVGEPQWEQFIADLKAQDGAAAARTGTVQGVRLTLV
jgi:hypothetical protein